MIKIVIPSSGRPIFWKSKRKKFSIHPLTSTILLFKLIYIILLFKVNDAPFFRKISCQSEPFDLILKFRNLLTIYFNRWSKMSLSHKYRIHEFDWLKSILTAV